MDVTWDCQVTDFGSHPIVDKVTGKIKNLFTPVVIDDYCWIGNRTSIERGTKLPHHTIVGQNSLFNKDYIDKGIKSYSLLEGQSAKLILENVERVYDIQEEYSIAAECWKKESSHIKIQ
ncbi:hypothetical protein NXY11_06775 [Parabacteroides faecis]|uniref:hypothetical protein n=1 Tax=Parabacteroides faecis TaxID=1217282 RepID=UPI002164AA88|nr:hypothetical protein [Parabacteroides faecis]MCS2893475.1 hypothetical protein [Parabacteroides faecis]UVQ47927.1 hypothetical protein NXY11_06775 [Parabacteroides faecis]